MLLLLHRVKGDEKQRRSVCQRNHIASHNGQVNRKPLRPSKVVSFVLVLRPAAAAQEAIEQAGLGLLTAGEKEIRTGIRMKVRYRCHWRALHWLQHRRVHAIRGAFVPTTLRGRLAFLSGAVP
ncbi:hypothetical protein IM817_07815 [Serratia marcescens]|uniref:hypothetical protein n=1 Tax=Serratia marcescens TaxID=615 RepID=UPI001C586323|nr:hypothetical protein [Serratia marcescens]QXX98085.1 hypothetical protein IM817_07815 [Serratia marcescens]